VRILILLLLSSQAYGFRLNTSNAASFNQNNVAFYVTSNSTCTNAGITPAELLSVTSEAAANYWNKVPSSRLKLRYGGIYETTDPLFLTGELCPEQSSSTCPTNSVPNVSKLLIACNSNTTTNFPNSSYIAISTPTLLQGQSIKGSVILINDTASSPFSTLSRAERVSVLAHELGHAVGLGHSNKSQALMYFENADKISRLSQDDIDGISYLYPREIDNCNGIMGLMRENNTPFDAQLLFSFLGLMIFVQLRRIWFSQR
jgi:hypothetical protein